MPRNVAAHSRNAQHPRRRRSDIVHEQGGTTILDLSAGHFPTPLLGRTKCTSNNQKERRATLWSDPEDHGWAVSTRSRLRYRNLALCAHDGVTSQRRREWTSGADTLIKGLVRRVLALLRARQSMGMGASLSRASGRRATSLSQASSCRLRTVRILAHASPSLATLRREGEG